MKHRRHRRSEESRFLSKEVAGWAVRLGLEPERIYVQPMSKKWASCSPSGRLYFASDLIAQRQRFGRRRRFELTK